MYTGNSFILECKEVEGTLLTIHVIFECKEVECTLGWVNFFRILNCCCLSCKMSQKNETDHFKFLLNFFVLQNSLIIFSPTYIEKKINYLHFRKGLKTVLN